MADFLQDLKLKLDPAFMPPAAAQGGGPVGPVVPPLRLGPTAPGGFDPLAPVPMSTLLPPAEGGAPSPDLFSHYAEAEGGPPDSAAEAMNAVSGAVKGLGTRDGLQIDKKGIGTTIDDWKLRFMPYIPFLNGP
jgi:hypothetical protein